MKSASQPVLQYPFFDMNADDAFNYGAIGVVIGHEMTHGFDDQGRQYDKDGNLKDWWTEEDAKRFDERAQVMVNVFDSIEVAPGVYGNGRMTLGENIADHGGLQVAYQAFKKGDIDGAVKFFDEAIQLETDNVKKAEKAYAAAAVLASAKKLSQARSYCQKAISFNENYGAPYILIANLYAMSPNWSDESALNKCTYFAVIDKLQRAKAVDPSVAEEANKLIGTYSGHTPQAKDLFMLGYKQGDRITIGGWIGETTTIR